MAVSAGFDAYQTSLFLPTRKRSHSSMSTSKTTLKWINEDTYRTTVLLMATPESEMEVEEGLETSARELGILPVQNVPAVDIISSSLSATTIASDTHQGSIMSQSTAPTSCDSSERRPSTSLSNKSSRIGTRIETPRFLVEAEVKKQSGFKSGLRKIGFRKKKVSGLTTPSMVSIQSSMTSNTMNESQPTRSRGPASIKSGRESYASHEGPIEKASLDQLALVSEEALQRSLECKQIIHIRTQQLEEKRRFLEYQTRLIKNLVEEREKRKSELRHEHEERLREQEEKNEKAVEEFEARQLEEELKQQREHETEKRAIQTRLKHMEAYCQTPSPPHSPTNPDFELRASEDSMRSLPERHITQQHYENLAQAYHLRDNMSDLHASKINVLRGKQKKALQNFILKKEREIEQIEKGHEKELDSIDREFAKQEAEIREEFEMKRSKLEARWKLQALIERTKMERHTGLKYAGLPDVVATEA